MGFVAWKLCLSLCLVVLSALFSGLTLGLFGLDTFSLKVISTSGSPENRRYAQRIRPLREKGNHLLCTLLLGNVVVNALLSILMAEMTSGLLGLLVSTTLIVIFGEIIPQATCTRHALLLGSKALPLLQTFMVLLYPVAKPIALILDCFLGKDVGQIYDKNELRTLVQIHREKGAVGASEEAIVSGAFQFADLTVVDIMTKLEDVYMLNIDSKLDAETLTAIWQTGHTRIPVYEKDVNTIAGMLYVKDLVLVHADDKMPLKNFLLYHSREFYKVPSDTKLPVMLQKFKSGKSHLAIVFRINNTGATDPFYETVGIVTLEDVIEQIIQDEIVDEMDVYVDIATKRRTARRSAAALTKRIRLTPNQIQACASFLHMSIDLFGQSIFDLPSVARLVAESEVHDLKPRRPDGSNEEDATLYTQGKSAQFFTLILSGKVEVESGKDRFHTELGAWGLLALRALQDQPFVPDFTARALSDTRVLRISASLYHKAVAQYNASTKTHTQYTPEASKPIYSYSSSKLSTFRKSPTIQPQSTSSCSIASNDL
eukprot:TRINITY_DN24830_c0_g1_i1.p1 TRINITY_DN24830_c0_g1~~TRINITY_DN24830_c0_g1_i1.p1  ORF type:complete len:542 (+),score=136.07 TRINITY_DN24830_c0_g1_i1:40-1665(+)